MTRCATSAARSPAHAQAHRHDAGADARADEQQAAVDVVGAAQAVRIRIEGFLAEQGARPQLHLPPWVWPATVSAARAGMRGNRLGSWVSAMTGASSATCANAGMSGLPSSASPRPTSQSRQPPTETASARLSIMCTPAAAKASSRTAGPPFHQSWLPSTAYTGFARAAASGVRRRRSRARSGRAAP